MESEVHINAEHGVCVFLLSLNDILSRENTFST